MTEERIKSEHFKQQFAASLLTAMSRPVIVTHYNKPRVVVISHDQYMRVQAMLYDIVRVDDIAPQ